ncbi:Bug family tripartite tricarboxylate transporter substrate binding protein [Cupriavidus basilensis]
MAAAPSLYKKLSYDPVKDFDGVFRFPDTPLVLLVGANSKFKTVQDLVAFASANPGKLNFGNAGVGSTSHLVAAMFAQQAKIKVTPVSYKGAGPALTDVMGGQVDGMFDQTNTALPQVKGGKVVAIAQTASSACRSSPMCPPWRRRWCRTSRRPPGTACTRRRARPRTSLPATTPRSRKPSPTLISPGNWTEQGIQLPPEAAYQVRGAELQHTAAEVAKWKTVITAADIKLD